MQLLWMKPCHFQNTLLLNSIFRVTEMVFNSHLTGVLDLCKTPRLEGRCVSLVRNLPFHTTSAILAWGHRSMQATLQHPSTKKRVIKSSSWWQKIIYFYLFCNIQVPDGHWLIQVQQQTAPPWKTGVTHPQLPQYWYPTKKETMISKHYKLKGALKMTKNSNLVGLN